MFHLWNTCFRFIFLLPLPLASSETIKRPVCVAERVSCLVVVTKIIVIIISSNVVCLLLSRYKAFVFFVIIIVFSSVFCWFNISFTHSHAPKTHTHSHYSSYIHSFTYDWALALLNHTNYQPNVRSQTHIRTLIQVNSTHSYSPIATATTTSHRHITNRMGRSLSSRKKYCFLVVLVIVFIVCIGFRFDDSNNKKV